MSKVSIILPVYNAEKVVGACIESIVSQTYRDIELIIVNDGSKDNSMQICQDWARKDDRIDVIYQENQGVSVARNTGIDKATGEFLMFIDSDDRYVNQHSIQTALECMDSEADLLMFGYRTFLDDEQKGMITRENQILSIRDMAIDYENELFHPYICPPWNKVFRLKLLKDNNIRFPQGIKYGEDKVFNVRYLSCANHVRVSSEALYDYRILPNPIYVKTYLTDLLFQIEGDMEFLKVHGECSCEEIEVIRQNHTMLAFVKAIANATLIPSGKSEVKKDISSTIERYQEYKISRKVLRSKVCQLYHVVFTLRSHWILNALTRWLLRASKLNY